MWLSPDDARSDFILAASALVFGTLVVEFVFRIPFYPSGDLSLWLTPLWVVLLMVVPPRFLAKYREQGLDAYGLVGARTGIADGLLLVTPLLVAGYVRGFSGGNVMGALLGRLRGFAAGGGLVQLDLFTLLLGVVVLAAAGVGTMYLFGLLVVRARDGFRATDMPLLEALRTYGLGAVAIGTVLGLLLSLAGSGPPTWAVFLDGAAMVAVILLTDRLVATNDRTTRATVLAPAIVAMVAFVFSMGGGLFSANLAVSLYRGAMAASVAIVLAVLLETRRSAWLAVPLVAATIWAPTCAALPVAPFISLGC